MPRLDTVNALIGSINRNAKKRLRLWNGPGSVVAVATQKTAGVEIQSLIFLVSALVPAHAEHRGHCLICRGQTGAHRYGLRPQSSQCLGSQIVGVTSAAGDTLIFGVRKQALVFRTLMQAQAVIEVLAE